MSLAAASNGGPEAKKFRFSLPTQVVVKHPLYDMNQNQGENGGEQSSNTSKTTSNGNSNSRLRGDETQNSGHSSPSVSHSDTDDMPIGEVNSESMTFNSGIKNETSSPVLADTSIDGAGDGTLFRDSFSALIASALFRNVQSEDPQAASISPSPKLPSTHTSHHTIHAPIPGALAVAASPAAQLFGEDDWSWHRNPAAAIRSGGTNKQTPVWKYFVYNKAENLSRCIIGDCTYILKGPHTSTLACHLKKHPAEYAEFQRLKVEYTRDRNVGTVGTLTSGHRNGRASSAASTGSSSSLNSQIPTTANVHHGIATISSASTGTSSINTERESGSNTPMGVNSFLKKPIEPSSALNGIFANNSLYSVAALSGSSPLKSTTQQSPSNTLKSPTASMSELLSKLNAHSTNPLFSGSFANFPLNTTSSPFNASALPTLIQSNSNNGNVSSTSSGLTSNETKMGNNFMSQNDMLQWKNLMLKNANIFGNEAAVKPSPVNTLQQGRKWTPQDRRQREMETKLALMMCNSQIPLSTICDPFFRDFIETAQPKFQLPVDETPIDQMLNAMHGCVINNMKQALVGVNKFTLLLDVVSTGEALKLELATRSHAVEDRALKVLCVSIAYYAQAQNKVKVMFLGVQTVDESQTEIFEHVFSLVSTLLDTYNLRMEQVNRTIANGFEKLNAIEDLRLFPRPLRSYRYRLQEAMNDIVYSSVFYKQIRSTVLTMINDFCADFESMSQLSRLSGGLVDSTTELSQMPFDQLTSMLIELRESFVVVSTQLATQNRITLLDETQWTILENLVRLERLFATHLEVVQEGVYATIDQVVPSIMQLFMSLEKDFVQLGDLPLKLITDIQHKLAYILDPQNADFDAAFIQATALNPQLVVLLDETQLNEAKSRIEKALSDRIRNVDETQNRRNELKTGGVDALLALVERKSSNALSSKSSPNNSSSLTENVCSSPKSETAVTSASTLYPDLVHAANQRRKLIKERQQNGKSHYAEAMIQAYFDDALNNSSTLTLFGNGTNVASQPLTYWQLSAIKCAQLSELAIELLSVPSSTIPPDQILGSQFDGQSTAVPRQFNASRRSFGFIRSAPQLRTLSRDAIIRFSREFWGKTI
ncbi:hypothetical protein M3Y94_00389000 [Aphelenchoides besseyi]|nr:hypothetical protein M3Y94_00389000 [Aphelenchoides besseyi]KAI6235015.1 hypothetical protein M3Y95_00006800 [Aphelenchoides besseyi]